jgi:hypothetical protein
MAGDVASRHSASLSSTARDNLAMYAVTIVVLKRRRLDGV